MRRRGSLKRKCSCRWRCSSTKALVAQKRVLHVVDATNIDQVLAIRRRGEVKKALLILGLSVAVVILFVVMADPFCALLDGMTKALQAVDGEAIGRRFAYCFCILPLIVFGAVIWLAYRPYLKRRQKKEKE